MASSTRRRGAVKAYAAATDNVGLFFGEDIFFAIGSIVLIQQTLATYGYQSGAAGAGGVGDPDRDRRLPSRGCTARAAAARPLARRRAADDHAPARLRPGRRDVRRLRAAERARPQQPKRFGNAAFWGLMALSLLAGDLARRLRQRLLVLGLAGWPASAGRPRQSADHQRGAREAFSSARQPPVPAGLIIPATALVRHPALQLHAARRSSAVRGQARDLRPARLGVLLALAVIFAWLRPPLLAPLQEGRRLIDAIGWAAVLPQMLAALGVLFAAAGRRRRSSAG
jgi:hypothetical protein